MTTFKVGDKVKIKTLEDLKYHLEQEDLGDNSYSLENTYTVRQVYVGLLSVEGSPPYLSSFCHRWMHVDLFPPLPLSSYL